MSKRKVWIDCDPGIDDTLALIYALYEPSIEIVGISTVSGNVNSQQGYNNVMQLLEFLNITNIPVYRGNTCSNYVDASDTHGENGLGNFVISNNYFTRNVSCIGYIEDVINKYPNELTIICLGPLTNMEKVFNDYRFVNSIKELVIMGGAYRYPGNCSPVSEYNFWCDSFSANKVFRYFENCNKLVVVPLDMAHKFILSKTRLYSITQKYPAIGELIEGITQYYFDFHKMQEGLDGCVINDVVAVYVALNKGYYRLEDYYVKIVNSDDEMLKGMLVVDEKSFYRHLPNCKIASNFESTVSDIWNKFEESLSLCEMSITCEKQ